MWFTGRARSSIRRDAQEKPDRERQKYSLRREGSSTRLVFEEEGEARVDGMRDRGLLQGHQAVLRDGESTGQDHEVQEGTHNSITDGLP